MRERRISVSRRGLFVTIPLALALTTVFGCADGRSPAAMDSGGSLDAGGRDGGMVADCVSACDDGLACNGVERCAPTDPMADADGCVAGAAVDCNDGNACTTDSCGEPAGACAHAALDADMDGFVAASCLDGDDCDDDDATVYPDADELCDGADNDCSGTPDDGVGMDCMMGAAPTACTTACGTMGTQACDAMCAFAPCSAPEECNGCDDDGNGMIDDGVACAPMNDTCTSAIDITGGATVMGTTCGADNTLDLGCSSADSPDVFYSITNGPSGGSYGFTLTSGFAIQFVPTICSGNGGCGLGGISIGGGASITWYFAVERTDGTCGPFTLTATGS